MNFESGVLKSCADWYEQLKASPKREFANLSQYRRELAPAGAYVIWLRLTEDAPPLCLKIGKVQRASGSSLYSRLYDHWNSREHPTPNVLAKHLMSDLDLVVHCT